MKTSKFVFVLTVAALLVGGTAQAANFSFRFAWCESTPEFSLSNVPKGTVKLELKMVDLDVPSYNHGGAALSNPEKGKIACGAFSSQIWYPPTPPDGSHTYQWTIRALDKDGNELASAKAQRKFPE